MINYIIQVVLFQTLFLAVYDFFLQKETFFNWNRAYLLLTPVLSFFIPLVKFESLQKSVPNMYVEQLPTVFLNPQAVILQTVEIESTINYFEIAFYVGIALSLILFVVKLVKIIQLIVSNEVVKSENFKLVLLNKKESAFSFFNYIFIKRDFVEHKNLSIIQHEMVHCKQLHTLDLLFFEFLKIIMWFNPLLYVYQNRITLLHEYISDAEVVKDTDKNTYFNSILSATFNVENISFTNQFFKQSLIKKRIAMITHNKSEKMKQLKYLLIVPLLVGMLIYSSCTTNNSQINEDETESKFEIKKTVNNSDDIPYASIQETPIFPGCSGSEEELRKCLEESITNHVSDHFNMAISNSLDLDESSKRVYVIFQINKEGNISDIQARAKYQVLANEATRVIQSLPQMKPGKQNGEIVNVKYSLPIVLKTDTNSQKNANSQIKNESIPFAVIEDVPIYQGCEGTKEELRLCLQESITEHVSENFNAEIANNLGLSAGTKRIFVMFSIDKNGEITDVQARAPHKQIEEEAIRVIESIPKMIPGKIKGEPVVVKYSLPIAFIVE